MLVLQARAALEAQAEKADNLRKKAIKASVSGHSDFTTAATVDSPLLMRPSEAEVDEQWARALVRMGLPIQLVDDAEFRKAVLYTTRAGLSYVDAQKGEPKLPHRTKMSTVCIPMLDAKLHAKVTRRSKGSSLKQVSACLLLTAVSLCS